MAIVIYTYTDPYKLNQEPFWEEIKECPFFCVSQTMVNGLKYLYKKDFAQGRVTTVQNLVEALFAFWESTACMVKQHADIDNIISAGLPPVLGESMQENIARAFLFNREEVFESVRVMFELNMKLEEIRAEYLTPEQRFIVELYRKILSSDKRNDFVLKQDFSEESVDEALINAMTKAQKELNLLEINTSCVVIHGVHQFSPIVLRTIEAVSKFKKVILLFNYQPQYKNAYQTWIDIYSAFDCNITAPVGTEFRPSMQYPASYEGNALADRIGKLVNGQMSEVSVGQNIEIVEFDNMTEFAGYVADIFHSAEKIDPENPMMAMREQIYAADTSANDILKIYFPEQFGERQFLDYPLGHFFIAIADLWDANSNEILIKDPASIKECLEAGILKEDYFGQLSTIWGKLESLFDGSATIDDMLSRLKRLRKNLQHLTDPVKKEYVSHIAYYSVSKEEIIRLEEALKDLDELTAYFYEDFENRAHNFRDFYRRLKEYLQTDILDSRRLGEEFEDIIRRVLDRLETVEDIDASASFNCLKSTMSIYLAQETKPGRSANWIVRGFEQIDGDVLRSMNEKAGGEPVTYHFACLSDEDLHSVKRADFSWPLTDSFFEIAQDPVDWKYQVYVTSRKEYKNFKRYALLYGLEFNRGAYKISYVKRDGEKDRDPYFILDILGAKKTPFLENRTRKYLEDIREINVSGTPQKRYDQYDYFRYRICKYRFILESVIEGTTVYKDTFLLGKYMEVLLENQLKEDLQGFPISETVVLERLNEAFDELKKYFPFIQNVNRMDMINAIRGRLMGSKVKTFPILNADERQYMMIRELFIHKQLSDPKTSRKDVLRTVFSPSTDEEIATALSEEKLKMLPARKESDVWCQYCANREFCAACYVSDRG